MGISIATGDAIANSFRDNFISGFAENNHAETMKGTMAETVKRNWADGFKRVREKSLLDALALVSAPTRAQPRQGASAVTTPSPLRGRPRRARRRPRRLPPGAT